MLSSTEAISSRLINKLQKLFFRKELMQSYLCFKDHQSPLVRIVRALLRI